MREIYTDGDYDEFIIPKKFHKFYADKPIPNDVSQLKKVEYLDLLEFFIKVNYALSRTFNLEMEEDFKGIGYFENTKVAFFGEKYGATKFAIRYREFRKMELGRVEILTLNEEINSFFNRENRNHKTV